jgi:hypothetical protein
VDGIRPVPTGPAGHRIDGLHIGNLNVPTTRHFRPTSHGRNGSFPQSAGWGDVITGVLAVAVVRLAAHSTETRDFNDFATASWRP